MWFIVCMRNYGDRVVLRDLRRDDVAIIYLVGLSKKDMFDQTFFSESKTYEVVWCEKPQFQTPSFLISHIFNVVQTQKVLLCAIYCCLQAAGSLQVYNLNIFKYIDCPSIYDLGSNKIYPAMWQSFINTLISIISLRFMQSLRFSLSRQVAQISVTYLNKFCQLFHSQALASCE